MYVNFYGNNLNRAISIPMNVYKINAFSWVEKEEKLDVIGSILLDILKIDKKIDYRELANKIGVGRKYELLIKNEIKELKDRKMIEVEEESGILKSKEEGKIRTKENFYVFYDLINQKLLECILTEGQYNIYKKSNIDDEKIYKIDEKYIQPSKDRLYEELYELIEKSNKLCDSLEDAEDNELNLTPFYKIDLDIIENINQPERVDFLISISSSYDNNNIVRLRDPITEEEDSIYIKNYIRNKVEKNSKIEEFLDDDFDFKRMKAIRKEVKEEIEKKYKNILIDDDEKKILRDLIFFEKSLNEEDELLYKDCFFNEIDLDSEIKKRFKIILNKFIDVNLKTNTTLNNIFDSYKELNSLKKILIIRVILKRGNEKIKLNPGEKAINIIKKSSIKDYLKLIYIAAKNILHENDSYEEKVYDIFKDEKMVDSLNRLWLYRNNTVHREEDGDKYRPEYNLKILSKERLREVMSEIIEDTIYFFEKTRKFV